MAREHISLLHVLNSMHRLCQVTLKALTVKGSARGITLAWKDHDPFLLIAIEFFFPSICCFCLQLKE